MPKYQHILFKKNWKLSINVIYMLGQCEAIIKSISNMPLKPEFHAKLLKVSLIKGAQATTAIEGNTLTTEEIENIENGKSVEPSKEYQEKEIKNILNAFNIILQDIVSNQRSELITPKLIKYFHKLVGKNLGELFTAIPGKLRSNNVTVGNYRPPDSKYIPDYLEKLCKWLKTEFHYPKEQLFIDTVIQAIVTHVYIEWIHPFGDGNGRTGRLLEFYLMMRAGNPDIASHILSNHYNLTRNEYYRYLKQSSKNGDLSHFIEYAVQGLIDGLNKTLETIQLNLFNISWKAMIYEKFADKKYRKKDVFKRKRRLILNFPTDSEKYYTLEEIALISPIVARDYSNVSLRSLSRDLKELFEMNLLLKEGNKYNVNIIQLKNQFAQRKS